MAYPNTSGSFVRGIGTGRFTAPPYAVLDPNTSAGIGPCNSTVLDMNTGAGMQGFVSSSNSNIRRGAYGYAQGISYISDMTTMDGTSGEGRHMQIGVGKNSTEGSNTPPCLQLDYPGMWRFRWVIKGGTKTVSVLTKQNSTGSLRPSMVVKANPLIGVPYDISASAANANSWTTIGPISVTPTGTGSVWVELHNNMVNYPSIRIDDTVTLYPALFDHIVTT
jgi:hypothetical protein